MINIIVAESSNHIIGNDNKMCWNFKKEFQYFKKITCKAVLNKKNVIIMGYNTHKSIGKILKERINIIINREVENIEIVNENHYMSNNLSNAIKYSKNKDNIDKIFIIGGEAIYKEALKRTDIDKIYLTRIKKKYEGNKFFPKLFDNFYLNDITIEKENDVNIEYRIYQYNVEKSEEYQYLNVLQKVLKTGIDCGDRTGVGTKSIFGTQMRFKLEERLPVLTTKRVYWKGVVEELLWFLKGDTNNNNLNKNGVRIWDGNTSREFLDKRKLYKFKVGDIGATYGHQFRHFGAEYNGFDEDYSGKGFDQVQYIIDEIKKNPDSRRLIISLWNPTQFDDMTLPACLMLYQFKVYGNKLSCSVYQRSGDLFLGVPFNITSASLLTYIIAKLTNLIPDELIYTIGDAHIYTSHIDQVKEQLLRKPYSFPILKINGNQKKVEDFIYEDFQLLGLDTHPTIKAKMAI